jgi:hypothetical protein
MQDTSKVILNYLSLNICGIRQGEALHRKHTGRAIAQAVSRWLPGFKPGCSHVGFVVDKVSLG